MKKLTVTLLTLAMTLGLLSGCGGAPATTGGSAPASAPAESAQPEAAAAPVKTGLSLMTSVSKSKAATAEEAGTAQTNVSLVAVTVGDDGVIDACAIDAVQAKINFDATGKLTTDLATEFPSKGELGADYGMNKGSSIGKEWNEQADAFAAYAVGKTVEQLRGVAVSESGSPTDADLAASVTLSVADFISGIEAAVNNAAHLGAQAGDKLSLVSSTNMSKSKDAAADADGEAQAYATVAAVTLSGDTITSCAIDAVQAKVNFDAVGAITTDLTAMQPTKNEQGDAYGMKKASSIGKEWNEQAAAFAAYITGKTVSDVSGIAVNEKGGAADADLSASVTIGIGEFQTLIAKAAR